MGCWIELWSNVTEFHFATNSLKREQTSWILSPVKEKDLFYLKLGCSR